MARIDSIINRIRSLLVEPHRPSLLHGDLWGGNYMCDAAGAVVLIDPAVYYGHPEADLAMTELFGGFRPSFYGGYRNESPLQPGYEDRRDLYNLYHMLNHLNIFGGGYLGSVQSIVAAYS
jgi:fructosamine-3-kinase